jgi:hypothetical protein
MRIQVVDSGDVEPLLAFLARAEVSARKLGDLLIEVDPAPDLSLLLAIWKAMHPESDVAWV